MCDRRDSLVQVGGFAGVGWCQRRRSGVGGLLAYVASEGQAVWGGMLMFLYGLGLGMPLIIIGSTSGWALSNFVDDKLHRRATVVTGALLIGVGLYMVWLA